METTITDMNVLYDAYRASYKGSSWKRSSIKFGWEWLTELPKIQNELMDRTYRTGQTTEFVLNERGKIRYIHGNKMRDRVVRHALCDNVLTPCLQKYLIHNNSASQKGKGVDFARRQFEKDLHNYYLKYGDNQGYIGFIDFSKFYDNIRHDLIKEMVYPLIPQDIWWLMDEILDTMLVDVSYMTDEEYAKCIDTKFDSIIYNETVPKTLRTGHKLMAKSVNIGDQVSQNIGVFFPYKIDNYAKIVRGHKFYGRYMDDMYIICRDKKELLCTMNGIREWAGKLGLFINDKKTRISKLSDTYQFLKVKYSLAESGRVIKKINPKSVTRERRRMKAYKRLLDDGILSYEAVEQACKSWIGSFYKLMSKQQLINMKKLYFNLFGKELRWKK